MLHTALMGLHIVAGAAGLLLGPLAIPPRCGAVVPPEAQPPTKRRWPSSA